MVFLLTLRPWVLMLRAATTLQAATILRVLPRRRTETVVARASIFDLRGLKLWGGQKPKRKKTNFYWACAHATHMRHLLCVYTSVAGSASSLCRPFAAGRGEAWNKHRILNSSHPIVPLSIPSPELLLPTRGSERPYMDPHEGIVAPAPPPPLALLSANSGDDEEQKDAVEQRSPSPTTPAPSTPSSTSSTSSTPHPHPSSAHAHHGPRVGKGDGKRFHGHRRNKHTGHYAKPHGGGPIVLVDNPMTEGGTKGSVSAAALAARRRKTTIAAVGGVLAVAAIIGGGLAGGLAANSAAADAYVTPTFFPAFPFKSYRARFNASIKGGGTTTTTGASFGVFDVLDARCLVANATGLTQSPLQVQLAGWGLANASLAGVNNATCNATARNDTQILIDTFGLGGGGPPTLLGNTTTLTWFDLGLTPDAGLVATGAGSGNGTGAFGLTLDELAQVLGSTGLPLSTVSGAGGGESGNTTGVLLVSPTPTPSASPSAFTTPSGTPTPSATPSGSTTPSTTPTPTGTPSSTPSLTRTPSTTPSPSGTPTPSSSTTPSETPTATPTPSMSVGFSASPSSTPTPSVTPTTSTTPSPTPSVTAIPWTDRSQYQAWAGSVACSSTGEVALAGSYGGVKVTRDFGSTFSTPPVVASSSLTWSVGMSANASVMLVALYSGAVYVSRDGGSSFAVSDSTVRTYSRSAVSGDGLVMVTLVAAPTAQASGSVRLSRDGGLTWTTPLSSGDFRGQPSLSHDGSTIVLADYGAGLRISNDTGATWALREPGLNWFPTAVSGNGSLVFAAVYNGHLALSTDAGATFTALQTGTVGTNRPWYGVAVSDDGMYLAAVSSDDNLRGNGDGIPWTTADGGGTWRGDLGSAAQSWNGLCASRDGRRLLATVDSGSLFTSRYF
jgi:hypothetical protein